MTSILAETYFYSSPTILSIIYIMKSSSYKGFSDSKIQTDTIDEAAFDDAINIITAKSDRRNGVGTLSEKTVHAVLKYYYVPNEAYHEVKVGGFVADALYDGEIYEIQSKNFYTMKSKLDLFLKDHDVTIIYPIPVQKYIRYIDPNTGEMSEPVKSSKKGKLYDIVPEIYGIKDYLKNKKLHFILCFIEMDEYKILDGWSKDRKKGATKMDRFPKKIIGEFRIDKKRDFINLLPGYENGRRKKDCAIPSEFTTKDIAVLTGVHVSYAQTLLNVLCSLGLTYKIGTKGRCNLYSMSKPKS